jgi:hypothetical protein
MPLSPLVQLELVNNDKCIIHANSDITKGTLILHEKAIATGVKRSDHLLCQHCGTNLALVVERRYSSMSTLNVHSSELVVDSSIGKPHCYSCHDRYCSEKCHNAAQEYHMLLCGKNMYNINQMERSGMMNIMARIAAQMIDGNAPEISSMNVVQRKIIPCNIVYDYFDFIITLDQVGNGKYNNYHSANVQLLLILNGSSSCITL